MLNISLILAILLGFSSWLEPYGYDLPDRDASKSPPFMMTDTVWVDSVMQEMSIEERIGQLFMVAAYSNKGPVHEKSIEALIKKYHIGGVICMQGGPERQVHLLNRYQSVSNIPLLVAMDAEWGPSMRLDSTVLYPRQMLLGAIEDNEFLYQAGRQYARQLRDLGVQVNFAPVVDVNINPENPVINSRSYGENRFRVTEKAYFFAKGIQDERVLAVIKHFPGHGDTDKDSHKTLPVISHKRERLDSVELLPFRKLINAGVGGVMSAHLFVPALDSTPGLPTSLSRKVLTQLLRNNYGFDGLIFTDALNMRAVSEDYEAGELELKAFQAGNDVLLFSGNVPEAVAQIKHALDSGIISREEIDARCRRILSVKRWAGIRKFDSISTERLVPSLNSPEAKLLNRQLTEKALTLVKNADGIVPVRGLGEKRIASVSFGCREISHFQKRLKDYADVPAYVYERDADNLGKPRFYKQMSEYDVVIVAVHGTNRRPHKNFGLDNETKAIIKQLSSKSEVVLSFFGNPYALRNYDALEGIPAVLVNYNDRDLTQDVAAQLIFGGIPSRGVLPVSISAEYPAGTGVRTKKIRLAYSDIPEYAGVDSEILKKADSIAENAIAEKATPGCQILAARNGKVFYHKAFGHYTYHKKKEVDADALYDLASLTKIVATTSSLMRLYDASAFRLNDSLSAYLPMLCNTNKSKLLFKDILSHQARLIPWIPFYMETVAADSLKQFYYSEKQSENFPVEIAEGVYGRACLRDTVLKRILDSKLRYRKAYKYSDLGFYLLKEFIESQSGRYMKHYTDSVFYRPLGAVDMGYLPLKRFPRERIVPTEKDTYFRNQVLQGYVHDQGAAMLGGVSGHAGVFSNANDLAKMMQMFLNKGEYGGERFIKAHTVQVWTSPLMNPSENRRGLGFDKPLISDRSRGPVCEAASPESFGHSGFTGTYVWADPENQLIYIYSSNRVYPDAGNRKLIDMDVRTKIHEVLYNAIRKEEQERNEAFNY